MSALTISAFLGALAEAFTLVIIARVAFALTTGDADVKVGIGPLQDTHVSLWTLIALAGGLVLARFVLLLVQIRTGTALVTAVLVDARRAMVAAFLGASWPVQSTEKEGRVQDLVGSYASAAQTCVSWAVGGLTAALSLGALLLTSLTLNAVASIAVIAGALLLAAVLQPIRHAVRRRAAAVAETQLALSTDVATLSGTLQEIKVFDVTSAVEQQLGTRIEANARATHRLGTLSGLLPGIYQTTALGLVVAGTAVIYGVGVTRLSSIGAIVLIMVRALSYAQGVQVAYQRIHENAPYLELLQQEQRRFLASAPRSGDRPLTSVRALQFDHVSFEYRTGEPVLHDVSFSAECGQVIGIVGPSGAGKSTLVQLLLRLREPTHGRILADGVDVADIDTTAWHRHVAFVPQDPRLFDGSVAENIRFFRAGATDPQIERAARLAHLHDEIMAWPHGYDTPVGPRGTAISGGQRQRLCIARALVDNPEIVVLDEPTSSLDTRSEALIRDTLSHLGASKTIFVIAHRLSTLQICDRIMVVQDGRLEGFDDPAGLEASNPFYREALEMSGLR